MSLVVKGSADSWLLNFANSFWEDELACFFSLQFLLVV
jgi:hypothetical protein